MGRDKLIIGEVGWLQRKRQSREFRDGSVEQMEGFKWCNTYFMAVLH